MTVSRAEVFLLEFKLRQLAPRMNINLTMWQGRVSNTDLDDPVQFKFGSNSFNVSREDLSFLMPLVDDEHATQYCWLSDYLAPFIREYADK